MKNIAIIPARSGSKRLVGKNLRQIKGKTLIEHAINSAIQSQVFSEIILTSNDSEALMKTRDIYENKVRYHLRPESLSKDNVQLRTVICYMIDLLESEGNDLDFNIALLLPTSPLRRPDDMRDAYALLQKSYDKIDGIMSVAVLKQPPLHALNVKDGYIQVMFPEHTKTQSQNLEPSYIHDGSIIFFKAKSFRKHGDFYMPKMMPIYIDEKRAIDINTETDLRIAEFLMGG